MHADLNPAPGGHCRPVRSRLARSFPSLLRRARRGFALIVTLSLMSLLLLLVLTLTTLVRVNVDAANSNLVTAQARQNALLAAYIGIGQLQKFAGPDQRTTTTAYIGFGGEGADPDDLTAETTPAFDQIFGLQTGTAAISNGQAANSDTPLTAPYGATTSSLGGTWYWTGVWGPGVNPLALYTGQGADFNGTNKNAPNPILMNWLISGDEGTPLTSNFTKNGVVAAPPNITLNYTPDLGTGGIIASNSQPDSYNWTALTNDITITPKTSPPGTKGDQPAALLVGPNTAYTGTNDAYTLTSNLGTIIQKFPRNVNIIVAPIIPIDDATPLGAPPFTSGRYAFWVGDEGVKAKYTPVDPYVGNVTVATAGDGGQLSRYRFWAPLRTGIERMLGMSTYGNFNGNLLNSTTNFSNSTLTAKLKQLLEPSQIYFVDRNLTGVGIDPDGVSLNVQNHPEETLEQHYFDLTTSSYGVLADSLRGGLRYDLTTVFQETSKGQQTAAFTDPNNGLHLFTILPGSNSTTAASATTEPNVISDAANGVTLLAPVGPSGGSAPIAFHGPDAPPPPGVGISNLAIGGLRWDAIENFYNIALSNNSTAAVPVQPGSVVKAGITPLITQFRLRFGQFTDSNDEQYVSVEPEFVLANPYSFPITDAGGGMDLGFRINTSTVAPNSGNQAWEWFAALTGRNDVRGATNSPNGESIAMGYDRTQTGNDTLNGGLGGKAYDDTFAGDLPDFISNSFGAGLSTPGYYPFLKNTVNFPNGLQAFQNGYNSVLDNIAFHIPTGANSTFAPGEAKVFSLSNASITYRQPPQTSPAYSMPQGDIVAVVGSPLVSLPNEPPSGGSSIPPNAIEAVALQAAQPQYLPGSNLPSSYYLLRDTGVNTSSTHYEQYPTTLAANYYIDPASENASGTWPAQQYGYISTMNPAVAFTLELRSDLKSPTVVASGTNSSTGNTPQTSYTPGNTTSIGVAGPGQNVLTSIVNMDLTGAGLIPGTNTAQPDPRGYVPPFADNGNGFRRQYLGNGTPGGAMPVFLSSYINMIALPGSLGDSTNTNFTPSGQQRDMVGFYKDSDPTGKASGTPEGWFDPSTFLAYRVYTDFNLRATNMALPPFASFNSPWAGNATTPLNGAFGNLTNPINAYMTTPPYGRIFDEGPAPDDSVISVTGNEDASFSQNSLGKSPNNSGFPSNSDDAAWGYSNSVNGKGEEFVALYSLPVKGAATSENAGNNIAVPDVPMMSLGQLTHADFTQDDIWCSVGYQPGNAFGNSYFSPYVTRGSVMQQHPNMSATAVMLTEAGVSGSPAALYLGGSSTSLPKTVNAYDISYLMNVALWDRYFFSTLVPTAPGTAAYTPANPRLAFAAGYSAASVAGSGGYMTKGTTTTDPATGQKMFVAYAPARFMMIDGAFNVNSTSFEAWRAVLSALRGVAFSNGTGNNNGQTVSYFSRTMPSNALMSAAQNTVNAGVNDNNLAAGNATSGLNDPPSYAGFRQLTDNEIDLLAAKIVQQVHQRGPFLSLAQFVNRSLEYKYTGGAVDPHLIYSVSGPLQAALDMSTGSAFPSFNAFFGTVPADSSPQGLFLPGPPNGNATASTTGIYPDAPLYAAGITPYTSAGYGSATNPSANPYSVLTGIPGWLTQADLLETLAPILSARSDTFTIRSYGEALNPSINQANLALPLSNTLNPITNDPSAVQARAWCEIVVQRMPDYINDDANPAAVSNEPSTTTGYGAPNPGKVNGYTLSPVNAYFGRRFKIVSIKWLTSDDI